MNGIPVTLEIGGDREKVYFATRRAGDEGKRMRAARRQFHLKQMELARLAERMVAAGERLGKLDPGAEGYLEHLEKLQADQMAAGATAMDAKESMFEHAIEHARLSLLENYGEPDVDRILRSVTDAQVRMLITITESGEVPEDFFPSRATPPSESSISPSGGTAGASSSPAASAAPTSSPAT